MIEAQPERVATVAWANQEVPLALGVVPVGMAAANLGSDDDDDDGLLPWVEEELTELDAETPVLFDGTDGIDFEAVALLVLVADLCGQHAFGTRFPVGVITGVLGAPYLIWLIVRTNRTRGSV